MKTNDRHTRRAQPRRQRGFLSSKQAIVLLILIFLAPTFVAWVMHRTGDDWASSGTTNRGTLVHPARPLELSADIMLGEQSLHDYLRGRWTLVYIGDADCDDACRNNLYKIRQVRTAQNEHMKRVQRLYVISGGEPAAELTEFLATEHSGLEVARLAPAAFEQLAEYFVIDAAPVDAAERVYFVDPLGNLMMYYQPDADAGGMLKDLKKLLKYSRFG